MAAFEDQEDVSAGTPPNPSLSARRIGYSSRGNAAPVGETEDPPAPPLTLPGPGDDRQQEQEANALRRSYQANQQAAEKQRTLDDTLAKKTVNARREADFRAKGQKFYTDSFGDLQPEVDTQGKPRFSQSDWKKTQLDTTDGGKMWALTRRNESGQTETRAPKLVTSGDLKDPNLYHDFGGLRGDREVAGHVDDLAQSADPDTARVAAAYRTKRNAALRNESLKPLRASFDSAAAEVDSARLRKNDLDSQIAKLNGQISALDANPATKQTAGGILGIGAEPTSEAKRLQAQRATLQSQVDQLAKESSSISGTIEKGGALYAKHEQAKTELDLWGHQSKAGELSDLAEQRRTFLRTQKRSEQDDPILSQILAKQEEFGVKASRSQQRANELQKEFDAERQKAAASKTVVDQETIAKQAENLKTGRALLGQSFSKLNEDVQAGRIDPKTAADTRKALLDAERDHARSVGQLAGMADAASAPARKNAIEQSRAARVIAQGEQLYNLEKNAGTAPKAPDGILSAVSQKVGAAMQRVIEGTRDADGETRKTLAQDPAVQESAKAAAFRAGDANYSGDLYAKLPGRRIVINPDAFKTEGLGQPGAPKSQTWRDAIDQATKRGDLDPKAAISMRREYAVKEKLSTEAAIDAAIDNDTFRRWLAKERPDLTSSNVLSLNSYDLNIPANNPELRAEASRFLKQEPSVAQKIFNAFKMVGVGAMDTAGSAVRAVLPEDSAASTAIQEFSKGLNSLSMDARLDHHWTSTIGQGLGSSLAFAAPAGATAGLASGLKLSDKAVKWTVAGMVAGLGSAAQGQQMYDEARQAGADKDVADGARWLGYILGSTEALGGINDIVHRFGSAKAFSLGSALRSAIAEMTEETVQEIGQQGGNNAVARVLYDQNRDLFEGFADSATGAGGSAAIMSTIASVVAGVRYRRVVDVLNVARQSRNQAEAQLADVYARPETEAVKSLLPTTAILHPLDAQRTALETAIATEVAKKNPSEDTLLALHEQLAQLEMIRGSAARSLAAHAVDVAQAVAQSSALPDFVQIDPETNAPINNPASIGANRDAANALVKIGVGVPVAQLTEAEQQGLATIGEQLGSEMVRDVAGQPLVTDKAREWLVDQAPAASRILRETETERLASIAAATTAAATPSKGASKPNEKDQIQKEKGLLKPEPNVAPAPAKVRTQAEGASASVSFTNESGQTERVIVPADATIPSTGAPVRDQTSAEQWLAETSKSAVRDVQFMATQPGKASASSPSPVAASASKPTSSATVAKSATVAPAAILPHLVKRMRAAGADDRTIANSATSLAKRVNETVDRYRGLFGGRVEITDQSSRSGGFSYDANRDTLVISSADLGTDAETLSANPERIGQLIREEAIHRAAVRLEKSGAWKADELWQTLTPTTRDAFTRAYNQGRNEKSGARTTGAWSMGHEMVRMLVQGRLAVENGRLTLDGAAISEETASPGVIAKIADVLRKLRDYFTDLAGQLSADGNDPTAVAEVNRVVELVTLKLQALEKATAIPAANPAQNTAESVAGEKLKGEWVAFAPESGTLGIPRSEMAQFQNEHLGALTQFLAARGITHTTEEVLPGSLKPSQSEYSPKKVANVVAKAASGQFGPRSILISSDGYILDRHHQFVAALTGAPQTPIPVIRFSAPIRELFDVVHDFPSVEYAGGSKAAPTQGKAETAAKPLTREPTATNANATGTTKPDAGASAPAPLSERQKIAANLGVDSAQVGSIETVTHKGRTVRVVNLVLDVDQVDTSHNPDGSLNPDYPQALQPRDRSAVVYRDQQRRIAANPNLSEEFLSGTPDRGTPIMATVDGKAVTLIGNGRANAKALMYAVPDLAETAAKFKADIAARAAEKGLTAESVNAIERPVLVRHILDPLTLPELRAFSQESNEFSGAATNAVEQAKVDASRLTPGTLAFFNPEFDLDSAKNDDFRREFVRSVIGRAENITGPDLRRRVQAALFAKAFGDTEAGMAAFSRLAGEDDEGTRNLVRAMLDVAPAFAALRTQITAGNLHDLDLAPALTRAVQEIAVALREKPTAQPADLALDSLVNQNDLALDGARDPLDDTLLRFLVANRRNRADLIAGLNAYVAGVYAAGDPKQADMFGAEPPTAAALLRTAVEDPQAGERALAAAGIGRVLNSQTAEEEGAQLIAMFMDGVKRDRQAALAWEDYNQRLDAEVKARGEIVETFQRNYSLILNRFNSASRIVQRRHGLPDEFFGARPTVKGKRRIVEKLVFGDRLTSSDDFARGMRDIKDMLGTTLVIRTRAQAEAVRLDLLRVMGIDPADRTLVSPKLQLANPDPRQEGYRDDKLRAQFMPNRWGEVIITTPGIYSVKTYGVGHAAYEIRRTINALVSQGISVPETLRALALRSEQLSRFDYEAAWTIDSALYSSPASEESTRAQNSASETSENPPSGTFPGLPSGPMQRTRPPGSGTQIQNTSFSPSSSTPAQNFDPDGALNRSGFITSTPTNKPANRQPTKITTVNISDHSGNVDVSAIRGRNGELWRMFDRAQLDPQTGRLVPLDRLISTKDELRDPKFLAGTKKDPRQYAIDAMGYSLAGDPRNEKGPRAPLDVFANADGTFTIIDGNATAQAAMLAGWKTIPVNVRPAPVLASAPASDDLFGGLLGDYAQALPPAAKRNKAAAKKLVAKELPALPPAAFDDLFSLAQTETGLSNDAPVRSGTPAPAPNENQNRQPDTARTRRNGRRAFDQSESDDLGSLFGNPGAAPAGSDAGGPVANGNGNVANDPTASRDGVAPGGETAPLGETAERPAGDAGSRPLGDAAGSLSVDVPGSPDAGGRRVDARASAESKRLARVARSEALAPDAQNHRILPGDTIVPRGTKTRLTANVAAIKIVKRLETEQRKATPEEKRALAKYIGWGALSNVFDNVKGGLVAEGELDRLQEQIDAATVRATRYGDYYAKRSVEILTAERQSLENWDNTWGEGYRALKELLTREEWEAARKSTRNAHYTDREIIGAMWRGLAQMGFKGGRVLEPGGGIGHFFGLMPEETMRASELFGVELDSLSGRIFQALYPDAKIQVDGFQTARLPDNAFDLAISNVPFDDTGPHDPIHANPKLNLHNYFFAKALDKVRPNGLIAFITTANTMESQTEQRAYLAERADFVGAVRLPNNAFSENAGTDVTTDIIFLRKRDGLTVPAWAETWKSKIKVGEDQIPSPRGDDTLTVPITVNEYFVRHPEMVLGTHSMNGEMYAGPSTTGQYTVKPIEGEELVPKLETALAALPKAYQESGETAPITIASTSNARDGAFSYNEAGELGIYRNGAWKPLAEADPKNYGEGDGAAARRRKARDFVQLRDVYLAHLALMAKPTASDAAIAAGIEKLNTLYDNWKSSWNTFADGQHQGLKTDPGYYMVLGLERSENIPNEKTGIPKTVTVKADVLKKRTIFPNIAPTKADNALDALRISQSWKGHVDLDYMAELLGQEPETIKSELISGGIAFENPRTGQLEPKETYLSGKVREKLRQAQTYAASNPAYQRNVDALTAVQPPPMELGDIDAKLGGGWVPPILLEKFLASLGLNSKVTYTQVGDTDKWRIAPLPGTKYANANTTVYGAGGFDAITLLEHAIDGKTPIAWNYETGTSGREKRTTQNEKLTAEAADGIKRLTDAWEKFAKSDATIEFERDGQTVTQTIGEHTLEAFNEQFNGTIPEIHDGSHLTLPGSAPFLLGDPDKGGMRQHQKNGIWRAIQKGETFLAHGVGAGKTRELIAIAMEWKRLGLAQKPLLVVHNPTLTQFANETRKIYPAARVLVATKEDLEAENRRAFAARVASGDWDLVIMAHSSFNRMADHPDVVGKFIADQKAELEAAITAAMLENNERGPASKSKNPTIKELVKQLDKLEERLKKATDEAGKDATVYFQDMGIDGILVDEAHFYKKLQFTTKREQIAGLDRSSSDRASNLFMRLNAIREKTGGRNVVLATGTPITNTLAEIWTMIRLTSPKALKEFGVASFDQFANAFTLSEKKWELHIATNKLKLRNRLRSFVNGHGLAALVRSVMDVQMDLELGQPKVRTGKMVAVVSERGPALEAYMGHLKKLYDQWEKLPGLEKREKSNSAIPAVIYGIAKAATMDMRLIDPNAPDDPGSKVNTAVENVIKFYNQERERKGTQIIFADRFNQAKTDYLDAFAGGTFVAPSDAEASTAEDDETDTETPTAAGEFNLYQDIKQKLIARGIPASEIAIAMDYNTEEKRTAMFAKANAGTIRVMIGSTQKLGVGVNVQERLYAMHHLDVPQTPADLKQRVGRGWRSGNKYAEWGIEIENLGYGVKNTSDAGAYQVIEFKSKFSDQALSGKAGARFEDPAGGLGDNAAELKATFSGDPRMLEMVTLESEVRALQLQAEAFTSRQDRFREQLRRDAIDEKKTRNAIAVAKDQAERLTALQTKGFTPEEIADINGRLVIAENQILSDGTNQPENATMVANKILAPGVTLEVYAKGQVNARPKPNIISVPREGQENGYQNGEDPAKTVHNTFADAMAARPVDTTPPVSFRASAAIRLDGEAWVDAGITSARAKALPSLIDDAIRRAKAIEQNHTYSLERQITAQADAKIELTRGFEDAGLLAGKQARLAALQKAMSGAGTTETGPLADGRGPGGTMPALASGRATLADPNQLEFEEITPEELAAADRAIETATRAERVREALPVADKIAAQFRIPGLDPADVRQEARTSLITAARAYEPARGAFAPYAGTIIRNHLRDLFNREVRRVRQQGISTDAANDAGATILDTAPAADDTRIGTELDETRRLLSDALNALPPRLQNILNARGQGESFEAIAQREGVSKQAVAKLADNAMKFVRAKLKQAGVKSLEFDGVLASAQAGDSTENPAGVSPPGLLNQTSGLDSSSTSFLNQLFQSAPRSENRGDVKKLRDELNRVNAELRQVTIGGRLYGTEGTAGRILKMAAGKVDGYGGPLISVEQRDSLRSELHEQATTLEAELFLAEEEEAGRGERLAALQRANKWALETRAAEFAALLASHEKAAVTNARTFTARVWEAFGKNDEVFQNGRTDSPDAAEIAQAVSSPGRAVTVYDGLKAGRDYLIFTGREGTIEIHEADTARPYIRSTNAKSQGKQAGGGSQLYMAALDWIHNNGKRIKDDTGLTDINAVRRTSNFLASAIRWGTTKHLKPHADQGLKWTKLDALNVSALAAKEMQVAFNAVAEARSWRYDFSSGEFRDSQNQPLARERFETAVRVGNPAQSGVGLSTLQRAVITHSAIEAFARGETETDVLGAAQRGVVPAGVLYSSPAEDEAAIAELMRDLARDVPAGAIDAAARQGANEPPGNQTVGNPDLANPAGPDAASRKVMNAVDEARKETMERETHEQWRTAAVAMIERDRPGVLRDLLAKASDGLAFDNPVQVKAAQLLVNDLIQQAVGDRSNTEAMRQAQILAWSYREAGTEQARSFAARRDPFKAPADRYREFLAGAVFTPTPALRKQLATTWTPAEKQRRIASLNKQLADARAAIPAGAPSIPADVQKRISALNQALGEARQQKDRIELLNTSLAERMKRIETEFAKMGVTLDDMFAGEAYLRLRGQQLDNNVFDKANYSAIKRRALSLIKKGWSDDYIARKTGLSSAQVAGFYQEHVAALRERLSKLGDAALDPSKLDALNLTSAAARLASGEASLSAAERAARIEQMIAAMGYAKNDVRQQRTRRAPAARRNPKPTPTPTATGETTATEPGATPAYPDATGATPNDFGNRNLGLGENASAQPTGATPPSTNGPTGELENDAAPSSRLPGRTPAYPGATGRANPYDFADEESAPPAFDISDPVHVAQAARLIQAVDGNHYDAAFEFWVNSVLSGPQTQAANIIGNTANTAWDMSVKRLTEAALNAITAQNPNAATFGEFKHMARAMAPAIGKAWSLAQRTWSAETSFFRQDVLNEKLLLAQADFDKTGSIKASISGTKGRVIRIPGRLLLATDDFFKRFIATVEASAQAYRIAKSEGLTGDALESRIRGLINLADSAAWQASIAKADELTFQETHEGTKLGDALQAVQGFRNKLPGARYVLPFIRTPFNIFLQGLRQSPAGSAAMLARFAQAGFYRISEGRPIAQSYPQPLLVKHAAEQLIAWTLTALLYGAAAGDDDDEKKPILITGAIPYKNPGDNALNQRTARTPFTIRVGNVMVSYGRIEPAATMLATTLDGIAGFKQGRRSGKDVLGSLAESAGRVLPSLADQAGEKTFLRGVGDLVSAAKGERNGERANYLANFIASWIPNLIRQPLAKLDPYARDRTGGFGERLASSIVPQLAEPKIDAYGEKIAQPGLAGWRALVPIAVRQTPEVNRVDRLLTNWNQAHPDDDWAPVPLNRTLRLNAKTTRQMTAPELRDYAMRSGRMAAQMLRNAALNVEKPTADDMKRVKNAFSTARTITRRQMFGATAQEIDSP